MKILGVVLIVIGILMFVFGNVTFTRKEKVVDAGPVEINKKEKHTIAWPNYAGGVIVVAGVVILLAGSKRRV
jgi:uncharacterized membrane protein YidH (DUF202 family)